MSRKNKKSILTASRMLAVELLRQVLEVQFGRRVCFLELDVNSYGMGYLVQVGIEGTMRFHLTSPSDDEIRRQEHRVIASIEVVDRTSGDEHHRYPREPRETTQNFFVDDEMYHFRFDAKEGFGLYRARTISSKGKAWNVGYGFLDRWTEPLRS